MWKLLRVFAVLGATFCLGREIAAQDWPRWRGPTGDGAIGAAEVPASWPAAFAPRWRVEIGEGYSSPVVAAGRAFVHSRRDPQEIVTAVDLASGTVLWQQQYPAAIGKNSYAVRMGKGPNATPLVSGGRVFTLGANGQLIAWDAATGRRLWSKDYSGLVDTSRLFCGTSASPVLVEGSIVVQVGSDVRGGQIVALEPASGTTKWQWTGDGPGYATPVVIDVAGTRQIVTLTNRSIVSLDAATGRLLWSAAFPDEWHENIVTPVWTGTSLIVAGVRQGTRAYRLSTNAGKWAASEIWRNADVTMYMSSPVHADGTLYGLSAKRKGQFVALDTRTGVVKWATEGREGEHASILLTPDHLLFLTNDGSFIVAKRSSAGFTAERRYDLSSSGTWAAPVLTGGDLLVRDATSLIRFGGK